MLIYLSNTEYILDMLDVYIINMQYIESIFFF